MIDQVLGYAIITVRQMSTGKQNLIIEYSTNKLGAKRTTISRVKGRNFPKDIYISKMYFGHIFLFFKIKFNILYNLFFVFVTSLLGQVL